MAPSSVTVEDLTTVNLLNEAPGEHGAAPAGELAVHFWMRPSPLEAGEWVIQSPLGCVGRGSRTACRIGCAGVRSSSRLRRAVRSSILLFLCDRTTLWALPPGAAATVIFKINATGQAP